MIVRKIAETALREEAYWFRWNHMMTQQEFDWSNMSHDRINILIRRAYFLCCLIEHLALRGQRVGPLDKVV